jgi:hypothetical protein
VAAPATTEPAPAPAEGDGSPLEEGAVLRWRGLDEAIAACERGEIEDAKSELAFRRLAARIGAASGDGQYAEKYGDATSCSTSSETSVAPTS